MFNKLFSGLLFLIPLIIITSCKKPPGEGGFASIEGRVYAKNYDPTFTLIVSEYYSPGETVYIIYGDNPEVGNTIKTSYDGTFKFNYLQKGKYKIYVIGKDPTKPSQSIPKETLVEITITSRKQKANVGDLVIAK